MNLRAHYYQNWFGYNYQRDKNRRVWRRMVIPCKNLYTNIEHNWTWITFRKP